MKNEVIKKSVFEANMALKKRDVKDLDLIYKNTIFKDEIEILNKNMIKILTIVKFDKEVRGVKGKYVDSDIQVIVGLEFNKDGIEILSIDRWY